MSDLSTTTCSRHKEEHVTAFCLKHGQTLCMKCLLGSHKDCVHENNVEDIADTTVRVKNEIPEAKRTYEHLTTTSKQWLDKYKTTMGRLKETEDRLVSGIKQMRLRIIEQTNKLAADALEIVNSVVEDQRSMVQHDIDQLEEFDRTVTEIKSNIERCKADDDLATGEKLYVVSTIQNLHSQFQNTELIDRDVKLHFYISEELQYLRTNLISFGELCVEDPNCRNTGMRSRHSKVSLAPSLSIDSISDDEIDSSVFILPKAIRVNSWDKDPYCSIHVEQPPTPCPKPPPLPDMHPDTPIEEKHVFKYNQDKFQTLPRMRLDLNIADVKKTKPFYNESNTDASIPIPTLPKKRTSLKENIQGNSVEEKNRSSRLSFDPTYDRADQFVLTADTNDEVDTVSESTTSKNNGQEVVKNAPPEIKVRPPTMIREIVRKIDGKTTEEPNKLGPRFNKSPHSHLKRLIGQTGSGSDSSINVIRRDPGFLIAGDKIPPLPKMNRLGFNLSRRIDSIISNDSDSRHSDNEFLPNNSGMSPSSQKSSSLTNLADAGKTPSMSSDSSMETSRSRNSASSDASFMSSESRDFDSSVSDETSTNDSNFMRNKHTEMRFVAPLDTVSRKSVTYNLMFSLPSLKDQPKPLPSRHSTITGIAVTSSGMLFICDIENHCLQLFDTSGSPLFDYQIKEPFSCCNVRDDVVAVTSRDRKSLCIFDISNSKIVCKHEQFIDADVDIFGVGYTKGFFGICAGDRIIIITESLQPYRTVKPVVMVKKKRSKMFFLDVKYIAMEWSKLGFFIYTSENKSDRVSCVVVGSRDRPVWSCHVGKPKSVLLSKENVLVAAKHKIVVLEVASGHRLREIHQEVPTHPVHMVLREGWIYISKTSSSNTESRNIRKLPMIPA